MAPDFDLNSINTSSIDKIELMKDYALNGALIITTIKGVPLRDISAKGILPITARGFYKAREFYSPKYESTATNKLADLRTTIYWNPEVATNKNGNAQFEFYTADVPGNYRVTIEGIDENGNPGRQIYCYKVE